MTNSQGLSEELVSGCESCSKVKNDLDKEVNFLTGIHISRVQINILTDVCRSSDNGLNFIYFYEKVASFC